MFLIVLMIVWYVVAFGTSMLWLCRSIINKDRVSIVFGCFTLLTAILSLVVWGVIAVYAGSVS